MKGVVFQIFETVLSHYLTAHQIFAHPKQPFYLGELARQATFKQVYGSEDVLEHAIHSGFSSDTLERIVSGLPSHQPAELIAFLGTVAPDCSDWQFRSAITKGAPVCGVISPRRIRQFPFIEAMGGECT